VLKAFKYRIYPSERQIVLLNKHFCAARFVYNLALETKQTAYAGHRVNLSCFDLMKQLPGLRKECVWLKEVNCQSLQQEIRHLDSAFTRFFKGQANFPKYKKKSNRGSYNIPQFVSLKNNMLVIPKFREGIRVVAYRPIKGAIKQATISKTPTGKYFVSILCETGEHNKPVTPISEGNTVGIDLGIKSLAVMSDGNIIENPKFLKISLGRLKYTQRR